RKSHLLEDKQIPSVGVFDEVYLAFGRHLEEIHVTWAHLEKKRTRLRTNTKTLEDLCSQRLEMASTTLHDAATTHLVIALQHFMTTSARANLHADLEYSTHDSVTDIQEKDKNRSQNNKSEHENGKTVRSQKDKVKVNPGMWHWKEHRKPNSKT
ncbi:hypothetical protein Tco_1566586, partial [Tanacetum coccineum]